MLKDKLKRLLKEDKASIIDFETNGFEGSSVLEIAVIKIDRDCNPTSLLNRFYFPREPFNIKAIRINGLNRETILKKRENRNYPLYFDEDREVIDYLKDVKLFIGHNINFDKKFLPIPYQNLDTFCTMQYHRDILKIPTTRGYKNPKLVEVCNYYNIEFDTINAHSGFYDVYKTFEIVKRVVKGG